MRDGGARGQQERALVTVLQRELERLEEERIVLKTENRWEGEGDGREVILTSGPQEAGPAMWKPSCQAGAGGGGLAGHTGERDTS